MRAYIDIYNQCRAEVTVIGSRQSIVTDAIVDTGFDGEVCLPTEDAIQLGLELRGLQAIQLGDGSEKKELVFRGEAIFGNHRREVEIFLTEGDDTLIGTGLLADGTLTADFVEKKLDIVPK